MPAFDNLAYPDHIRRELDDPELSAWFRVSLDTALQLKTDPSQTAREAALLFRILVENAKRQDCMIPSLVKHEASAG